MLARQTTTCNQFQTEGASASKDKPTPEETKIGVRVKSKDHVKGAVYHKGDTRVVVDRPIVTDSEVAHHRPDIVVFQRNKVTLIEVAVAWEPTVSVQEREKRIKYQALAADIAGQYDPIKPVYVCTVVIGVSRKKSVSYI